MIIDEEAHDAKELMHYGILRRSGRYPWGSHNNATTRSRKFLDYLKELTDQGLSEAEIAKGLDIKTTQLRAARSLALNAVKQSEIRTAVRLKNKGWSNVKIGERMGKNESSVRALLDPDAKRKADILIATSEMLKQHVAEKKYVDVGEGTENMLQISNTKLKTALAALQEQGYELHKIKQRTAIGNETTRLVLTAPGVEWKEVRANQDKIQLVADRSEDGGETWAGGIRPPLKISPHRVSVRYGSEGGAEMDGVILVRPGVEDISLGKSKYAQVRIQIGDGHYMKGMAMYSHDLPDGVDLLFNTNKEDTGNKLDALKKVNTLDPDNPFGAQIWNQITKKDEKGNVTVTSAMNIVNEEGNWISWSRSMSAQMLSKQKPSFARKQLAATLENKKADLEELKSLTNPTIKRHLLEAFADSTDRAAVKLNAASVPGTYNHVILPVTDLDVGEVYAPNYENGQIVALVRHPHGGPFEIPILRVNNNHPTAKTVIGPESRDAVGIHPKVAERLSGADFDGDTVLVIPNDTGEVVNAPALEGLKGFDPKAAYPPYDGMKPIKKSTKQKEMGRVSNLITDMTVAGAPPSEIVRAVRHSMVIIDAEKHNLDYRSSYVDNGIAALRKKYQNDVRTDGKGGSATLLSRANSPTFIPNRKPRPASEGGPIDRETGKKVFVETGETKPNRKTGEEELKRTRVKTLSVTDDAHELSTGHPIEEIYAEHSNAMKKLANEARLELLNTPNLEYSPSARKVYAKEREHLLAQLNEEQAKKPYERQAQAIADVQAKMRIDADPDLESDQIKKIKFVELERARARLGVPRGRITVSPREWDAIQAGAITDSQLRKVIRRADMSVLRDYATPKRKRAVSSTDLALIRRLMDSGHTRAQIANQLGIPLSTLDDALYGDHEED